MSESLKEDMKRAARERRLSQLIDEPYDFGEPIKIDNEKSEKVNKDEVLDAGRDIRMAHMVLKDAVIESKKYDSSKEQTAFMEGFVYGLNWTNANLRNYL